MAEAVKCPNCGTAFIIQSATSSYQSHFKDIFEAAKGGIVKDVAYFIENGTDVNAVRGHTPFHYAAEHNSNVEVLKYLISKGAKINAKGCLGRTPLRLAAQFNSSIEVLSYLISAGADVNTADNNGQTPLFGASKFGDSVVGKEEKERILRQAGGRL